MSYSRMNQPRAMTLGLVAVLLLGISSACQRAAEEPMPAPREAPRAVIAPATAVATAAPAVATAPSVKPIAATPLPTCPSDPDKGGPKIPTYPLSVPELKLSFEAEFVSTPQDSERGLMYRTSMAENHGMLFKLPRKDQTFWMHNTCISLDMLFLETDGKIVGILESVPTLNDEPRSVGLESVYVLEMNAGWVKTHGVRVGQRLVLPDPVKKLVVK